MTLFLESTDQVGKVAEYAQRTRWYCFGIVFSLNKLNKSSLQNNNSSLKLKSHFYRKKVADQSLENCRPYGWWSALIDTYVVQQITSTDDIPTVVEILHELICALMNAEQYEQVIHVCDTCINKHTKTPGKVNMHWWIQGERTRSVHFDIHICF